MLSKWREFFGWTLERPRRRAFYALMTGLRFVNYEPTMVLPTADLAKFEEYLGVVSCGLSSKSWIWLFPALSLKKKCFPSCRTMRWQMM